MKTRTMILLFGLAALLPACTSPFGATTDQFRIAQGMAMQGQVAAAQQASLAMAGVQLRTLAPRQSASPLRLAPLAPLAPLSSPAR